MSDTSAPGQFRSRSTWLSTALIVAMFALAAGTPPPDVNEAHYLCKARHYWDPEYAPGDAFLESADAHLVFYWLFGWLTVWLPLPAVAWLGRGLAWAMLASAWTRLCRHLGASAAATVGSAALMLALQMRFQMAGEWLVGGVEAKSFAWGLVFYGLSYLAQGRWTCVWPLLGAASALHVLVGGWAVVAAAIGFTADRGLRAWSGQLPALAVGGLLALAGLWPALQLAAASEPSVVSEANQIYVFERLAHHLSFHKFRLPGVVRFAALCALWAVGWRLLASRLPDAQRRLQWFALGALLIGLAGVAIDLVWRDAPQFAAALLKYYWHRLADVMAPVGAAALWIEWRRRVEAAGESAGRRGLWWGLTLAPVLIAAVMVGQAAWTAQTFGVPRGVHQFRSKSMSRAERRAEYQDWLAACRWIRENTAPDARFLTPRHQSTLTWFAGRAEVTNWKDIPQDAAEVVAWWERQMELFPREVKRHGLVAAEAPALRNAMRKHGAEYLILDRARSERGLEAGEFERVFPPAGAASATYEVYRQTPRSRW